MNSDSSISPLVYRHTDLSWRYLFVSSWVVLLLRWLHEDQRSNPARENALLVNYDIIHISLFCYRRRVWALWTKICRLVLRSGVGTCHWEEASKYGEACDTPASRPGRTGDAQGSPAISSLPTVLILRVTPKEAASMWKLCLNISQLDNRLDRPFVVFSMTEVNILF